MHNAPITRVGDISVLRTTQSETLRKRLEENTAIFWLLKAGVDFKNAEAAVVAKGAEDALSSLGGDIEKFKKNLAELLPQYGYSS